MVRVVLFSFWQVCFQSIILNCFFFQILIEIVFFSLFHPGGVGGHSYRFFCGFFRIHLLYTWCLSRSIHLACSYRLSWIQFLSSSSIYINCFCFSSSFVFFEMKSYNVCNTSFTLYFMCVGGEGCMDGRDRASCCQRALHI